MTFYCLIAFALLLVFLFGLFMLLKNTKTPFSLDYLVKLNKKYNSKEISKISYSVGLLKFIIGGGIAVGPYTTISVAGFATLGDICGGPFSWEFVIKIIHGIVDFISK